MLKTNQLPPSNYSIKFFRTLGEFTRLLKQEKLNKRQMLKRQMLSKKFHEIRKVKLLKTNPLKLTTMK